MQNLSWYTARPASQTRAFVRLKGIQGLDMRWGTQATATDAALKYLKVAFFEQCTSGEGQLRPDKLPLPAL